MEYNKETFHQYKQMLSATSDFMSLVDRSYRYLFVNQNHLNILEKKEEEIVNHAVEDLYGNTVFYETIKPNMERAFAGEEMHLEHWITLNGKKRFINESYFPYYEGDECIAIIVCARDKTDEYLAKSTLKEVEDKFSKVFQSSPGVITLTSLNTDLIFDINETFTSTTGYSREDAIGKTTLELGLWCDEEDRNTIVNSLMSGYDVKNYIANIRDRFGNIHNISLSANMMYVKSEKCMLITSHDMTEQKHAEESLRISDERFKKSFAHAPTGMVLTDSKGCAVEVNKAACEMSGYCADEMVGMSAFDITHPDDMEETQKNITKLFSGEIDHYQVEKRYRHKKGHYFWVDVNASVIRDQSGNPLYLLNQSYDITQRKRAEEALHKIAQSVSALTGSEFFRLLAQYLAETLETDYAVISRITKENNNLVRSLAAFGHGQHLGELEYHLTGTPCQGVLDDKVSAFTSDVQKIFPDFQMLKDLGIEAYVGTPIFDSNGKPLGLIAVLDTKSIDNVDIAESMLKIFAIRASAELEREKADEELRRYEQIVSSTADMMFFVDGAYRFLAINDSYLEFFNKARKDVIGFTQEEVFGSESYHNVINRELDRCMEGYPVNFQELVSFGGKGDYYLDINFSPYFERDGSVAGVVGSMRDITSIQKLSLKLDYQASHDELTGLINRREFERRLSRVLETVRIDNSEHALCYMDLDQFKVINDSCGHFAGDELLRQLGNVLVESVRKRDTVARLGGDEFATLLEHCSLEESQRIAADIKTAVEGFRFTWEGKTFQIGVSIGLVSISNLSGNLTELMKQADVACYQAKDRGRNRIHIYTHGDANIRRYRGEMKWVVRINRALEENRFVLFYQNIKPVIKKTGKHVHCEILLRMVENDEIILPGLFLPAAERYGLIDQIDRWVVREVIEWVASNSETLDESIAYSINLSGVSIADGHFLNYVIECLEMHNIESGRICFEITETAAIANLSRAMKFIKTLREYGCLFALDDFGSGLSSFAYLRNLMVDYLKIDGVFVRDIDKDPIAYSIVKSVNELGQLMGKQTVAECVENKAIQARLLDIGIDYAQGYSLAEPKPLSDFLEVQRIKEPK